MFKFSGCFHALRASQEKTIGRYTLLSRGSFPSPLPKHLPSLRESSHAPLSAPVDPDPGGGRRGRKGPIMAFFRRKKKSKDTPSPRSFVERKCRSFLKAARFGNMSKIGTLLDDQDVDIHWTDEDGNNCLMHVTLGGTRVDVAYMLLTAGADPTVQNRQGQSAFLLAAQKNQKEMLSVMLQSLRTRYRTDQGALIAAVNSADNDGMTALMYTSLHGDVELTNKLLEAGSLSQARNKRLGTPLMLAAKSGSAEVASILLEAKADLESRDADGLTSLILASQAGHADVVELLLKRGAQVDQVDREGNTALFAGSQAGHPEVTQILVEAGANLQHQNKKQETVMTLAARSPAPRIQVEGTGTEKSVREILLESGASDKPPVSANAMFLLACVMASIFAVYLFR